MTRIILLIWFTHNIIQRLNDYFQLHKLIWNVDKVSLNTSSCCTSCTGDNLDGPGSVIFKVIFANCKFIPDSLGLILYCNITINLAI